MSKILKLKSPPQVGEIKYDKSIRDEYGVYSIDRFTFNFRMCKTLYDALFFNLTTWTWRYGNADVQYFDAKRFGTEVKVMQFGGVHIEMWEGKNERSNDIHALRLDYSPNKCSENAVLKYLQNALATTTLDFVFDLSRVDFAYDIEVSIQDIYVLSRKAEGNVGTTRYYGKRGTNGMLRVYDKRQEMILKSHIDIGKEVTRLEWEQRGGNDLSFTFDKFCTADFSNLQFPACVIPYINPERINQAFKEIAQNTRKKYKRLFTPYPLQVQNFEQLLILYYNDFQFIHRRWSYTEEVTKGFLEENGSPKDWEVSVNLLPSLATLDDE